MSTGRNDDYPEAAVLECTVCKTAYVLRYCIVLGGASGTRECYAFFPDCRSKRACEREAKRRGIERKTPRTDGGGDPLRIAVMSRR